MKLKRWTKKELENRDNWDFSYCWKWAQNTKERIWQYEAEREFGLHELPFTSTLKNDKEPKPRKSRTSDVIIERPFFWVEKAPQDDSTVQAKKALEAIAPAVDWAGDHEYLHLIEIDHRRKLEDIEESFYVWLREVRSKIGIRRRGGRFSGSANILQQFDDLTLYRLKSAGFKPSEMEAIYKFEASLKLRKLNRTPDSKESKINKSDVISSACRATRKRLGSVGEFLSSIDVLP